MTGDSLRMMINLKSMIYDPHDYEQVFCSVKRVREVQCFWYYHPRVATIVYIFGEWTILIRARYFDGP